MSEYITDEAVEKAASAMHDHGILAVPCESGERACLECGYAFGWFGVNESEEGQRYNEHRARAALEAAAPLIAAKVLGDARKALRSLADEWEQRADFNAGQGGEFWQGMVVKGRECASEARARADALEAGSDDE